MDVKINEDINALEVRLIDQTGTQLGIVSRKVALEKSKEVGLDLVLISEASNPPVCKIIDYRKNLYEQKKKQKEQAKNSRASSVEIKELHFTPNTAKHDIEVKVNQAKKFLTNGDKVKFVVDFHGRELSHMEKGRVVLKNVLDVLGTSIEYKVEKEATQSGRSLHMIINKKKTEKV